MYSTVYYEYLCKSFQHRKIQDFNNRERDKSVFLCSNIYINYMDYITNCHKIPAKTARITESGSKVFKFWGKVGGKVEAFEGEVCKIGVLTKINQYFGVFYWLNTIYATNKYSLITFC